MIFHYEQQKSPNTSILLHPYIHVYIAHMERGFFFALSSAEKKNPYYTYLYLHFPEKISNGQIAK